jgi:diadenosine tetraphosphate (Ap4A) HIT family hydrolase
MHWFILVPETTALDLLDLPQYQREALLDDATRVSAFVKAELEYPRVNVGALGLLVPQLHLHVIGREEGDACWPAPVWGNLIEEQHYTEEQLEQLRRAFSR